MNTASLKQDYQERIVPILMKEFNYTTVMQCPKLQKIVLNQGLGEAVADKKIIDVAQQEMTMIAGQKAVATVSKKDIANFKVRKKMPIGVRVTLRGERMYEFLERLVRVALPRIRDFKGIANKMDGRGNYTLGITEQIIFPEINIDSIQRILGMNITFVTTAKTDEEGYEGMEYVRSLGEVTEEMILEAVERTKSSFTVPAVDKDGNPILDENGNQKQWCCIEIIGLYIHDDEVLKGIHAHVDYVPVAHNYKRGLSMQPGLTKALEEMGLFQDRLEDLAEERTRLMMEKFGIDYHDSDYVDEKGKQLPKSKLTKEQLDNRKMASELVPCRTPQMKLQDLFRENLKAVMQEHSVPVAEVAKGDKEHLEKRGWADAMRAKAVTKEAKLEKAAIDNEIVQKTTELSELDEKLEQEKSDIKLIEDKRASLSSWDKKPKSEKELFDQINKEVLDHKSLTGHKSKLVPLELWEVLKRIIKNYFRMEQENKSLRASTAMKKVKESEAIIEKKDSLIDEAQEKADAIIKDANNVVKQGKLMRENGELKSQLELYESVMERNPEFARAVEQEERKRKLFKVKGKHQEIVL